MIASHSPAEPAHPLRYWGGGPLQNGANNLQQLWSPLGFCGSYTQEKWAKLIYMADWTNFTDSYFDTGNLTVPAMPPEIDRETVSDQIRKADEERIKNYKTYGGA
ncbi:hypothetical protein [Herbaspirillum sp. RV1423]|uniref:hypothetical protein n=1 Tax=Herbaspirillum sp. RV1423 TaxID=1443993 RepID=UPI0004BC2056|nr:hypothetical protein [Herbaspirillum sp. RV1423]